MHLRDRCNKNLSIQESFRPQVVAEFSNSFVFTIGPFETSLPRRRGENEKLAAAKKKIRLDLISRIESLAIFDVVTRPTVNYRREVPRCTSGNS